MKPKKPQNIARGYGGQKQGWYKLKNPEKFIKPLDEFMDSYRDGYVNFKSSLEQKAFQFQDTSKSVQKWSCEPFQIKYLKPTTGKIHRYFIDLLLVTSKGTFLIEIKPKSQTKPPKKPRAITEKSKRNYQKAIETFQINKAKWEAQTEFQKSRGFEFLIFTEDLL